MKTTTSEAYKLFCGDLVKNFDKDWFKVGSKLEFGFQFLEHVPEHAWKPMVKIAINQWDGWPRNWAKAVKEIYETWRRDANAGGLGIKYNKDDDIRFPVNLMAQAFNILQTKDYPSYVYFCDQVGMPRTDRDRVENKHRICTAHEQDKYKIAEIGTRLNRKTNRPAIMPLREFGD
jgi:hypothetical protein